MWQFIPCNILKLKSHDSAVKENVNTILGERFIAYYDRDRMEWYIDKYFETRNLVCDYDTRTKIYVYIATYGLLWTSWSEAKRVEGQDFTDYAKVQYQYAKDYLAIVKERLCKKEEVA